MTVIAEYIGDIDSRKLGKIVDAANVDSHTSDYHLNSKTHRITFKALDKDSADTMRDRIEHTGIEFSRLEVVE